MLHFPRVHFFYFFAEWREICFTFNDEDEDEDEGDHQRTEKYIFNVHRFCFPGMSDCWR